MSGVFDQLGFEKPGESSGRYAEEALSKALLKEIENADPTYLLSSDVNSLATEMTSKHLQTVPKLYPDKCSFKSFNYSYPHNRNVKALRFEFYIPFEGNANLLQYKPSQSDKLFFEARIEGQDIIAVYDCTTNSSEEVKQEMNKRVGQINLRFMQLAGDIGRYNTWLLEEAKKRIQARVTLLANPDWESVLGIPRKQQ